jgi:hypothetical protein
MEVMMKNNLSTDSAETVKSFGRRSFLKNTGASCLGVAGAALAGVKLGAFDSVPGVKKIGLSATEVHAATSKMSDLDAAIGQFALNLEYLEAEFYTMATTGQTLEQAGIPTNGIGTGGATTGGSQVNFSGELSGRLPAIAAEITYDEQQHVLLLRSLLGPTYTIAKPAINLDALGIGFADFQQFLQLARAFEDTGSSAYGGAASLITSKSYLQTAVRINIAEAMHVSNLRGLIAVNNVPTTALDGQDVLPPPSGSKYFTVDTQALGVVRTTSEVLAIVYANSASGTSSGGFFPNGVNGTITTV